MNQLCPPHSHTFCLTTLHRKSWLYTGYTYIYWLYLVIHFTVSQALGNYVNVMHTYSVALYFERTN